MKFNKLVRDKIPDIIEAGGARAIVRTVTGEEYLRCLEAKLDEEAREFHEAKNMEELADILEVVFSLSEAVGGSRQELMEVCRKKREQRGGFSGGVFLIERTDVPRGVERG